MDDKDLEMVVKDDNKIWFCGCQKAKGNFGYGERNYHWVEHQEHEKWFDKKSLTLKFVCHKNRIYKVVPYEPRLQPKLVKTEAKEKVAKK